MFSIHIKKRPLKIAFLINPNQDDWQEQIDAIWEYNQEKWGGRYNPLIPTDGNKIDKDWLNFLEKFDADYFISVFPISDELKKEINNRFSPIDVEVPRKFGNSNTKPSIHTHNEGVSILPSSSNLNKFDKLLSNNILASVRGIDWTVEKDIFKFLLRNFGVFQDILYIDKTLEKIDNKQSFRANNNQELTQIFNELDKPSMDFVFPIQYSMLGKPDWHIELENGHSYNDFGVIVGDTFEEQLFLRNKIFYERDFRHNRLSHIWLPTVLIEDLEFMKSLGKWLKRMSSNLHLFSFSMSENKLEEVGEKLCNNDFFVPPNISTTTYDKFPFPKYFKEHEFSFWNRYSPPVSTPKDCDFFRANSLSESFELKSPSQSEGTGENGYWIAEIYAEADKNRYFNYNYYIQNQPFWWRLPRKNYLALNIFKDKGRINSSGFPCIQLTGKNPVLKFQLPTESDLLRSCVLGDWSGKMSGKVERKELEIHEVQLSNIGKYLSGFIKVFGSLGSSHGYLSERYWRNMFDVLSGRDLKKDRILINKVKDKLSKKIKKGLTQTEIKDNFENLSDFVIQLSKEVTFDRKELEYSDFLEKAKEEHKEFQSEDEERIHWEFNENSLNSGISDLLKLGVLQMGFSQKCPKCGSKNWYLIDEAKQFLICDGCTFNFLLPANPELSYRLSSLAKQGIFTHGLVPVVLVLGQLLKNSNSSFFFAPSMDLLRQISDKSIKYERATDADIICIQDGNFIIGEIKQSQNLFTLKQMMDLADIAEAIEVDVIIFSSLDERQNSKTSKMIDNVKERLKDTKIKVGWYQLEEEIFQPTRGDC